MTVANSGSANVDGIFASGAGQERRTGLRNTESATSSSRQARRAAAQHEPGDAKLEHAGVAKVVPQQLEQFARPGLEDFAHHALLDQPRGRSPTDGTSTSLPSGISVTVTLP